jgi:hypothetical protein
MFNINSGYVGSSRSVRSQVAINYYEVPISMINKALIEKFLKENAEDFSIENLDYLKNVAIYKWKYVAKAKIYPTSWHHTSAYFNKTDHYELKAIAEKLVEIKDTLDQEYQAHQESQKKEASNIKYGVIKVQVWGGTKKRPKLEGYEEVAGIIIGDWLFYKNNHSIKGSVNKYKTTANKVEWLNEYGSYSELVKNHKEYKNSKQVFNKLILEKGA